MNNDAETYYWQESRLGWAVLLAAVALSLYIFRDSFDYLAYMWFNKEEYSHAVLIPFISAFLVWQKKDILRDIPFEGSLAGFVVVLVGVLLMFLGEKSALVIIVHYGFLTALLGIALAYMGWKGFRVVFIPLLILAFTIPLPGFLYQGLSNKLQLLSSELGVWFIRLFDISVHLEGNVIDLGGYKLQVVEACNGLRYLFPLVTLGFIAAYFFQGATWKRVVIFLSSVPITVIMNSFRIGMIGVTVEYWGQEMAEGFLHDFEGWAVFMSCTAVLILEMWMLAHIGREQRSLREVFGFEFPEDPPEGAVPRTRRVSASLIASAAVLALVAVVASAMPEQEERVPERERFTAFPNSLGEWEGRANPLEQIYIDALRFDDYTQVEYFNDANERISLFVSYYASQIDGDMPHSPRACLPGGGWNITDLSEKEIANVLPGGGPIRVNRVVIQSGEHRQLVYYWFQQRGRYISSEFAVKWYIFADSLLRHRSDGALVRVVTYLPSGTSIEKADARLIDFTRRLVPALDEFVPE